MTAVVDPPASIWRGSRAPATLGLFSLAFMVAFEALAVATVMPLVAEDLDGLALYAVAFAAPVGVSILSRTAAAPWIDRAGPGPALRWGVVAFVVGTLVCGLAPSMEVLLVGRGVQGLGMGPIGVGLYVLVAQVYPASLRPRAMTVLTSAWTLPAVVGPGVAGALAHAVGWRAVFLVAPLLAVVSLALTWRPLAATCGSGRTAPGARRRTMVSAVCAAAILLLAVAGQRSLPAWPLLLLGSLVLVVVTTTVLVPPGTWSGRRGLPSLLAGRSLVAAAYFGVESYVPLALVSERGLSAGTAGLALTGAALTWFAGSWVVAHPGAFGRVLATARRRVTVGAAAVVVGLAAGLLVLVPVVPVPVVLLVWAVGGFGMGASMAGSSVQVLALAPAGEEGSTSAAMQTNDSIAESTVLALGAVAFAAVLPLGLAPALLVVLGGTLVVALAGLLWLPRGWVGP